MRICFLCCVALLVGVLYRADAQPPCLQLTPSQNHYPLGTLVEYLADPMGRLSLSEVQQSRQFVQSQKPLPSFGFSEAVYWFRFRVRTDTDKQWLFELGYSHFRTADVYVFSPTGQLIQSVLAGNSRGNQHRPLSTHNYVFPLQLKAGQEATVYLRADGMASKLFPLAIYEQHAFYASAQQSSLWLGFYFGFIAITMLYHFFLYLYRQPRSYLLFSGYLLAYLLNELIRGNGNYIERLVLVHHPFWQQHVVDLLNGVILMVCVMGLRFYSVGLQLNPTSRLHRGLIGLTWINGLLYALLLTGWFPRSWSLLYNFSVPLLSYLAVLVVSLWRIRDDFRPAWYYFAATFVLLASVLVVLAERAGKLTNTGFWAHNAIQIASVIEIMLLSLGFAEGMRAERHRRKIELELADLKGRKSEREWLSLLMHTSFGTTLSAILFEFGTIDWSTLTSRNKSLLKRLQTTLGDVLNEAQLLSRSLPPALLEQRGLLVAFETLVATFNKRSEVQFRINNEGIARRFEARCEFELYLVGLELLNNVRHHAQATEAQLALLWDESDWLTMRVTDNGRGFVPESQTEGYGLTGIRQLVEQQLQGTILFTHHTPSGTAITIRVRLHESEAVANQPISASILH